MRRTCQPFSVNTAVSFSCDCQPSFAPESQVATPVAIAGNAAADATNDRMAKTASFMNSPLALAVMVSSRCGPVEMVSLRPPVLMRREGERGFFTRTYQGVRRRSAEGDL